MTKFEDNISPYVSFVEGAAPSSPAATNFKLYYDSADHLLKWKNSAGTVTTIATGTSGGQDNWHYEIQPLLGSQGNTNWTTVNISSTEIYGADYESSGAQNDEIYWDIGLSGGTWDLTLLHWKGVNRGIYTVSIDGSSIGTIDGYAGVSTQNTLSTLTGASITAGKRRLKLKMATKNASSSSYFGVIQAIQMRRTA